MTPDVAPAEWETLLDGIGTDTPPALELADAVAGAYDVHMTDAQAAVYAALDDGVLVENDTGAFGGIRLAEQYTDTTEEKPGSADATPGIETDKPAFRTGESAGSWENANFATPDPDTYPPELLEREQWMGQLDGEKMPFAPWGDRDHPDAPADKDARYKWGLRENYADGETVALAEDDPRLGGRVFIQRETDSFAFVDGDDVRDPETGDVHPVFLALLEHLGRTYADVSTSGAGVHAYYRGGVPIDGKEQATFEIDTEPWGANDTPPTVEIYANKHVCVTTGEHVPGTPLEVTEWNADALAAILDAHGIEDAPTPTHDTDKDRDDLEDYDADATSSNETTDEIRDVLKAVNRLDARDVAADTIVHTWNDDASTSGGNRAFVPEWGRNANGTANIVNDEIWQDTGGRGYGGADVMAAIDSPDLPGYDEDTQPGDLEGTDWLRAVEHLRALGYDVPKLERGRSDPDADPTAVLPKSVRDLSHATTGFDWRHTARQGEDTLTLDDVRERATDTIADALQYGDRVLVEALPASGKSYGAVAAAAETGEPITVLTGRGRKEQYAQYREWCDKHGLDHYTLPSYTRDCDTANGEHGKEWQETVQDWYARGATPKEIHKNAEYELGRPLPCQEHKGEQCPYTSKWDFDPDDYDVLIGHYSHAYRQDKVVSGRTVVIDEFPGDTYVTELDANIKDKADGGVPIQQAVSYWLQTTDGVPFEDYTDLLENRTDQSRRADALLWFENHGVEPDEISVFDDSNAHADAPLAAFTMLAGENLGNGVEAADIDGGGTGFRNRETGAVRVLRPPTLTDAPPTRKPAGIVALDGTPTKDLWEAALGERLNKRNALQQGERVEYIRDALNLNLVRTTEYVKPYNKQEYVNTENDAALLEKIGDVHGEKPGVITSSTAISEYDDADILQHIDGSKHYGNVLGSNEFKEKRVGAVIGSNHYGDEFVKMWGAFCGKTVESPNREDPENRGRGLSYGAFGDQVLTHMREHDTLQAVMRFGRDGNGSVVYVHTNTLPEWVPVAGEGRIVSTWSDGMKTVIDALEHLTAPTTAEITERVDVSRQQVFAHLETLRDRGVLTREQDTDDARRVVWVDDGIHRLGEHGEAELEPVDLEELDESEVRQLARSSIYTWEFTNRPDTYADQSGEADADGAGGGETALTDGGRPPDPPE